MRVIVTRVQPQAGLWVQKLAPAHQAVALPLIETRALSDPTALISAWQHWAGYAAVMFVSSHAVQFFFASKQASAHDDYATDDIKTRAWATGPGTRDALLAQGVAADLVDSPPVEGAQFDSEALWQQVQDQIKPGARVLIVRGDTRNDDDPTVPDASGGGVPGVGRDWLAQRMRAAGAQVDFVVAYRRGVPAWTDAQTALAVAGATDGSVWVFSSAEAVENLRTLLPEQYWADARAVATHPRVAEAVRQIGFGVVSESRPTLPSVLASIESQA